MTARLRQLAGRARTEERAAHLTEYALFVALVAAACLFAVSLVVARP